MMLRRTTLFSYARLCAVPLLLGGLFAPPIAKAQTLFTPATAWSVQELAGICAVSSVYNNGFMLSFARTAEGGVTTTLDTRQTVFMPGHRYTVKLFAKAQNPHVDVQGIALSESMVEMRLPNPALLKSSTLGVDIEGNRFDFSLSGLVGGGCFSDFAAQMAAPAPSAAPVPVMPAQAAQPITNTPAPVSRKIDLPPAAKPAAKPEKLVATAPAPRPIEGENVATPPLPQDVAPSAAPPAPLEKGDQIITAPAALTWTARAGDDVRTVVEQWASIAGVDLSWTPENSGTVEEDIAFTGSFEAAVAALLAQSGAGFEIVPAP